MPAIMVNVAVIEAGKILLTQRDDFKTWCLPGGGVEEGESVAQAAVVQEMIADGQQKLSPEEFFELRRQPRQARKQLYRQTMHQVKMRVETQVGAPLRPSEPAEPVK